MKQPFIGFLFASLILVLSACAPVAATATPTPVIPMQVGQSSIANNQVSNSPILPGLKACTPPALNVTVTGFCANQGAGLGGATIQDPSGNLGYFITKDPSITCNWGNTKADCSGTQDAKALYIECSQCSNGATSGDFQCAQGMLKKNGECVLDPNGDWITCTYTSHFDDSLQACVDNTSGKPIPITDLCPPGYPYYTPDGYCWAKPQPEVFNCQYYQVTLGECLRYGNAPVPGLKCMAGTRWNGHCCANVDNRCQ